MRPPRGSVWVRVSNQATAQPSLYLCPLFLLVIFGMWVMTNVFGLNLQTGEFKLTGYVLDLVGSEEQPASAAARMSIALILAVIGFMCLLASKAGKRWQQKETENKEISI
ncbi:MAG: hypothetical protein P8L18_15635 [Verrucomicrobiota bacterium]|nr:hypothetical protein [Verrucomicrobiota bacterium]